MKFILALSICLMAYILISPALGCVYTVRDVGFVDMGAIPYSLYFYVRDDTPADLISAFRQISYAALMESNVVVETVNVDAGEADQMRYLDFWEIESFPAAVIVSPNGQSLSLPISIPGKPFRDTVWSALEDVITSPKRVEILSTILKSYCVIVLFEGKDDSANSKAQKAVNRAIKEIDGMMSQMPKAVGGPPHLITIPPELFSQEKMLLWSLGVNEGANEPYAAILYGRGRRIGPVFAGEEVTVNAIFDVLSVIGSSCECGLDRGWVLGTMIPLKWDQKVQSDAAKHLGFDPESPVVKTEISQILSLGPSYGMDGPLDSKLEEYDETPVEFQSGLNTGTISPAQMRQLASRKPDEPGAGGENIISTYRTAIFIGGGMIVLIMSAGTFIVLRARRREL